ncbi:hypothetical protein [Micromonospora sp. NPDC005710]|uniref:hypothetical protein n=1 Tax=Micromonospora sp. NPDC005710 TaxID=3157051 RepID=UPI00340960C4
MADGEYGNDPVTARANPERSGGSIFDDLRWLRHLDDGGGAGAESGGGLPAHDTVWLVNSAGEVVGTAHHNPETGVLETDYQETMTIHRTSHPEIVPFVPATVPLNVAIPQQVVPKKYPEPVSHPQPQESVAETPTTDVVDPSVFIFRPTGENWQETGCVRAVVFRHGGSAFEPPVEIVVGVTIGVPLRLRDGTPVTWREAQIDSGVAAQGAAERIKALLTTHAIVPAQVQPLFAGYMGGALTSHGIGYRLSQCWPG